MLLVLLGLLDSHSLLNYLSLIDLLSLLVGLLVLLVLIDLFGSGFGWLGSSLCFIFLACLICLVA